MRYITLLTILLTVVLSLALFNLKYEVQDLANEIDSLSRAIDTDQEAIHVLKAEWSHLSNPNRLRNLTERYLSLRPMEPHQLSRWDMVPMKSDSKFINSSLQYTPIGSTKGNHD